MSARAPASRAWTPGAAAGVASLFLAAFFFGGLWVGSSGVEYHIFGLVDGLAALIIIYVLLGTFVLSRPRSVWGAVVLAYAAAATAQLVALLLPPPGLLQWVVLGVLVYFAWNASYGVHRSRVIMSLGLVSLMLAALKYSVLPFVWARTGLPRTPFLDLRALGEGVKGMVVEYVPSGPVVQLFALIAILAWVVAVWLQWPPAGEDDWLGRLSRGERDRLLRWLLSERRAEGRAVGGDEARGYLDRPGGDG